MRILLKRTPRSCLRGPGRFCHSAFAGDVRGEPDTVALILAESASAILRWLHVIAGIAWIGSSFYFIHLDLSLRPRPGLPAGVKGDEWQVHGGGFYHMMKYVVAPKEIGRASCRERGSDTV